MLVRSVYHRRFGSRRGQAPIVELGLTIPWLVIIFMGMLDFGFCAYGLIATEDAARIAATWCAASSANAASCNTSTTTVCTNYVIPELQYAPNMRSVSACGGTSPVSVTATNNASGADTLETVTVSVTYTVNLLALTNVSLANLAIHRTVQLPVL